MSRWSWWRIGLGSGIAVLLPVVFLVLAALTERGVIAEPTGLLYDIVNGFVLIVTVQLILAGIGIWTVGVGARLASPWAWVALVVIALPLLAFAWFLGYATYGGATGNPF